MKLFAESKKSQRVIIAFNIIVIILILILFYYFNLSYNKSIEKQNIDNVINLNQTSEKLSVKVFENEQTILGDSAQYILASNYTVHDTLDFLTAMNSSETYRFELIGTDCKGYYTDVTGKHIPVDYSNYSYGELGALFKSASADSKAEISFSPEFTDKVSGNKCIGLSVPLGLKDDNGKLKYYTLMYLSESKNFIDMVKVNGDYENMSTAITNKDGDYIIGNSNFKSNNFFKYLYIFNDLSLDQRKSVEKEVAESKNGHLFYQNSQDQDCIFVYSYLTGYDWYIITAVPLSEFSQKSMNYTYAFVLVAILAILFLVNITWQRYINRKLKESAELERKANKAKSDFLSRMSHDIRTPLNAVIGFSELAKDELDDNDSIKDSLEKINSSGQYLLGLINDILDMSKIESNKMELKETVVNGVKFLNEISDVFGAQAKLKGINFTSNFTKAQTPWVVMDPLRSKQIYSNLLNNAIKFTDEGGSISWTIVDEQIEDDTMRMTSIISDTGCGMSEEFMQHIFTPFDQDESNPHAQESGTGLGLAIVKSLVDLAGGTINVDSELGKGSTFTIIMERKLSDDPTNLPDLDNFNAASSISLDGKRILLCEDHELNIEIATKILQKRGMIVDTAVNGQEGLDTFKSSPVGFYDAILMDIRMPVMDGLKATSEIRALPRADACLVPIIAMTANAFDEDIEESRKAGINVHLSKPINPQEVYRALEEQLKL